MILYRLMDIVSNYVDGNSTGDSSAPSTFDRIVTTIIHNIDSDIEFFKENGNSKYIR